MSGARAKLAALIVFLALPTAGHPEDGWPRLYEVAGVAADDVLNVRAAPSTAAEIIGQFAPGRRGIEVIRTDPSGRWGRVNSGERAGWVAMRYLAPERGPDSLEMPLPMRCFGTEPFWLLELSEDGGARLETAGEAPRRYTPALLESSANNPNHRLYYGIAPEGRLIAVIRPESCSDGMSDREYGIGIDLFAGGEADGQFVNGCCSIER